MFCKNCGNELKENELFCPNCGKSTNYSTADELNGQTNIAKVMSDNKKGKRKMKKKTKILLFVCLGIFLLFCVIGLSVDEDTSEKLANADFNSGNSLEETKNSSENISSEEELAKLKNSKDINAIADYFTVCPEEDKAELSEIFKKAFMTYLAENRSQIYSHKIEFIKSINVIMNKIPVSCFEEIDDISVLKDKVTKICNNSEKYNEYMDARELLRNCMYIDGEIILRVGDSSNDGEYINEYLLEYYGAYDDWTEIIIYSEESLQPGRFISYIKYKTTEEYVSEGFEYTYDVYTVMSDREVEKYLKAEDITDTLYSVYSDVDECFSEICDVVDNYAKKYPVLITEENYIAEYVGGYKDFPYDYLHTLSLNSDNTFDISINIYEGFADYSGTYKKEGNLIICESEDVYFELVISGETLIYHNRLEYTTAFMEDGTEFIR